METILFTIAASGLGLHLIIRGRAMESRAKSRSDPALQKAELVTANSMKIGGGLAILMALFFLTTLF